MIHCIRNLHAPSDTLTTSHGWEGQSCVQLNITDFVLHTHPRKGCYFLSRQSLILAFAFELHILALEVLCMIQPCCISSPKEEMNMLVGLDMHHVIDSLFEPQALIFLVNFFI